MNEVIDRPRGRFLPGVSGNPAGRKPGSRNKSNVVLDRMAEAASRTILQVVIDSALSGDMDACALIMKRVWPELERKEAP
jgi:hypothetical protein